MAIKNRPILKVIAIFRNKDIETKFYVCMANSLRNIYKKFISCVNNEYSKFAL